MKVQPRRATNLRRETFGFLTMKKWPCLFRRRVTRKYSEIVWLPMSRTASTSTNADVLTGLPNTYSDTGPRSRERRLESCHAPPMLGNLGGVRFWERNGSGQPRADAARCGQLDRAQCSDQRMNPSSGELFERSRGSGRRGQRFGAPSYHSTIHVSLDVIRRSLRCRIKPHLTDGRANAAADIQRLECSPQAR
jgi:hypothetical protein